MANIRTASKVGTIYYDLYDGEGFIVLNDRWFVLLPDICELDVLQDLIADSVSYTHLTLPTTPYV